MGVRVNTIAPGYFPSGASIETLLNTSLETIIFCADSFNDISGMTDTDKCTSATEFKEQWGIPFGRPGNAIDYSKCVISTITVSLTFELFMSWKRAICDTDRIILKYQNEYVTGAEIVIDGGWLLQMSF